MIKYKHKISGEIAEESPRFKNFYLVNHGHSLHKRFIENSNDWQKVEELDYEILSYSGTRSNVVIKNSHPNFKLMEFDFKCKKESTVFIYSVKRLSDGEVFTIGDLIDFRNFGNKGPQPIEKFETDYFDNNYISAYNSAYGLGLILWKKIPKKTPLFTTEDGVEIFEGDNYSFIWLYNPATNQSTYTSYTFKAKLLEENCAWSVNAKYFSTKEKAEEYVLLNKPCLSIMEVAPIFGQMHLDNSPDVLTRNLAKLKSLVQAKL